MTAATSPVADKRTIVRVYPGLAGSGGVPIVGANISMTCTYKDFYSNPCPGVTSIAPLSDITVNPADAGNIATTAQEFGHALAIPWHASCVHPASDCLKAPEDFPCLHGGICTFGFDTLRLSVIDFRQSRQSSSKRWTAMDRSPATLRCSRCWRVRAANPWRQRGPT